MPDPSQIPDVSEGDELSADWLNSIARIARALELSIGSGFSGSEGPDGVVMAVDEPDEFWAVISYEGSGGQYSWHEVTPTTQGFVAGGNRGYVAADPTKPLQTVADPAREVNNHTGIDLGTRIRLRREPATHWVYFQLGPCAPEAP